MPDAHDHSNEKIQEALKLLEEAACEKRDALKTLISERYTHLKDAMSDSESNVKESFNRMSHRTAEQAQRFREVGEDRVREVASQVDENVHNNPWPYIGGAAVGIAHARVHPRAQVRLLPAEHMKKLPKKAPGAGSKTADP